jgi:hypothetical protein
VFVKSRQKSKCSDRKTVNKPELIKSDNPREDKKSGQSNQDFRFLRRFCGNFLRKPDTLAQGL